MSIGGRLFTAPVPLGSSQENRRVAARSSPQLAGGEKIAVVAGHCLVPCDLGSLGLGGLPASMLLGSWPLSCSL